MRRRSFADAISALNEKHPVNVAAENLLSGYPVGVHRLHLVTLLLCALDEFDLRLPTARGSPSRAEIYEVLNFLERASPEAVMRYLTEIGDRVELTAAHLNRAESIPQGASRAMQVLLTQLALGAHLPG